MRSKKGQIQQLTSLVAPLVAIAIVLAIGFLIFAEVRTQALDAAAAGGVTSGCDASSNINCTSAVNGTDAVVTAMADIPGWLPIIVIVIIGSILISLVSLFRGRG